MRSGGKALDNIQDNDAMADSFLKEKRSEEARNVLAGSPVIATRVAGGDAAAGARLSSRAQAQAEAEELKKSMEPLVRELAKVKASGGNTDQFLENRAKGLNATGAADPAIGESDKYAAMHELARQGRGGSLRSLEGHYTAASNPGMAAKLQEALQANVGSVIAKDPDLIKGPEAAFKSVKGADLAGFSPEAAQAYMKHLTTITDPVKLKVAIDGFNSAVEDITRSPDLQSKFDTQTGKALRDELAAMATSNTAIHGQLHRAASIQNDNKIR
jgi:hypothetical protein